jgi:hypothetical protein
METYMFFILFAAVSAVVTFIMTRGVITSVITGLAVGFLGWMDMPILKWGFVGVYFYVLLIPVIVSSFMYVIHRDRGNTPAYSGYSIIGFAGLYLMIAIIIPFISSGEMFYHKEYRDLIGDVKTSKFSEDVSPIDGNFRVVIEEGIAKLYVNRRMGTYTSLEARTDIGTMNLQLLDGSFRVKNFEGEVNTLSFDNELVWAGPLNHSGFLRWVNNDTTEGYVIASATNSQVNYLITSLCPATNNTDSGNEHLDEDGCAPISMRYLLNGSYFGDVAQRHLYTSGYASTPLTSYSFEIEDGTGRPYFVATQYEHKIGAFGGQDSVGVVVLDIQTGEIKPHPIDNTPKWIDRIQSESMVISQVNDNGHYNDGFWNAYIGKIGAINATPGTKLVKGADGELYSWTDMRSKKDESISTVGHIMINTRTKETRFYKSVNGGITAARAKALLVNNEKVKAQNYTSSEPILYNVNGIQTYFAALIGADGEPKMFAFIDQRFGDSVGIESSTKGAKAALRLYLKSLSKSKTLSGVADLVDLVSITAKVSGVTHIGETYYLMLEGNSTQEFWAESVDHIEVKWTHVGDEVAVSYQSSEDPDRKEPSVVLQSFDNLNYDLKNQ